MLMSPRSDWLTPASDLPSYADAAVPVDRCPSGPEVRCEARAVGAFSWFEPLSSSVLAAILATNLRARLDGESFVMLTLTYDRDNFESAEACFDASQVDQHVPLFMRRLARAMGQEFKGRWLCKLEFQRAGWPHWHIILTGLKRVPHEVLKRCWGFGNVWVSPGTIGRAVYACKYMAKAGEGVPSWVLARKVGSIKVVRVSSGFWGRPSRVDPYPEHRRMMRMSRMDPPSCWAAIGAGLSYDKPQVLVYCDGMYRRVGGSFGEVLRVLGPLGYVLGGRGRWIKFACEDSLVRKVATATAPAVAVALPLADTRNPDAGGWGWWPDWVRAVVEGHYRGVACEG